MSRYIDHIFLSFARSFSFNDRQESTAKNWNIKSVAPKDIPPYETWTSKETKRHRFKVRLMSHVTDIRKTSPIDANQWWKSRFFSVAYLCLCTMQRWEKVLKLKSLMIFYFSTSLNYLNCTPFRWTYSKLSKQISVSE